MRLGEKVAIITGGSRGHGEAEARMFAQEGAKVVVGDLLEDQGQKVVDEINEAGGAAVFLRMDVSKEEDWCTAIDITLARFGKLDVLVNNASISGPVIPLAEYTVEQWDQVLDVDLKGVFLGCKHAIPEMRKAGGGSIINISSIAGIVGGGGAAPYSAAKAGVRLLSKAIVAEYSHENIRANNICPGAIDTIQMRSVVGDMLSALKQAIPVQRIGTTKEIANLAVFLASDESSYMTGSDIVIDGGWTARVTMG